MLLICYRYKLVAALSLTDEILQIIRCQFHMQQSPQTPEKTWWKVFKSPNTKSYCPHAVPHFLLLSLCKIVSPKPFGWQNSHVWDAVLIPYSLVLEKPAWESPSSHDDHISLLHKTVLRIQWEKSPKLPPWTLWIKDQRSVVSTAVFMSIA